MEDRMAFLDNMIETLTSAGRDVSQKAKEVSNIAKLKMDIKSKQAALDKQYIELGKHYYEMNKEGEVDNAGIANVSTLTNEIAALQAEILKIQGACVSPQCGMTLPEGTAFCSQCGASIVPPNNN